MQIFLIWAIAILSSGIECSPLFEGMNEYSGRNRCDSPEWEHARAILKDLAKINDPREVQVRLHSSGIIKWITDPGRAFDCAIGSARISLVLADSFERQAQGMRALRARQAASIYLSYDFQMKGQEWIEQSNWNVTWLETVEKVTKSMQWFTSLDAFRNISMFEFAPAKAISNKKIAIVTVCDYDSRVTPLGELSIKNKKVYANKHGYDLVWYKKAPEYEDFVSKNSEMHSPRPQAWSKIDAMLLAITDGRKDYDWIMWMDCDSFFMNMNVGLEQVIELAENRHAIATGIDGKGSNVSKRIVNGLKGWKSDKAGNSSAEFFNREVDKAIIEENSGTYCGNDLSARENYLPANSCGLHVIASEDGLMLNTGIFFVRKSVTAFGFLHRVKQLLFGKTPVTFHPWWEQTGIVLLLSIPFTFTDNQEVWNSVEMNKGFAPFVELLSQKQLNAYPPLISGMLKTHAVFEEGDIIVSFSGCKIYSSQSVCNHLFMQYFLKSNSGTIPEAIIKTFTE